MENTNLSESIITLNNSINTLSENIMQYNSELNKITNSINYNIGEPEILTYTKQIYPYSITNKKVLVKGMDVNYDVNVEFGKPIELYSSQNTKYIKYLEFFDDFPDMDVIKEIRIKVGNNTAINQRFCINKNIRTSINFGILLTTSASYKLNFSVTSGDSSSGDASNRFFIIKDQDTNKFNKLIICLDSISNYYQAYNNTQFCIEIDYYNYE